MDNQMYWLTYGEMPPDFKPMPLSELQELLQAISKKL